MARIVLARSENSMIGWRWTGNEPAGLNDLEVAIQFGAYWDGDELVHDDVDALQWQVEHYNSDDFMQDND